MKCFNRNRDGPHKYIPVMCTGFWVDDISKSVLSRSVRGQRPEFILVFEVLAPGRGQAALNIVSGQSTRGWAGHPPGHLACVLLQITPVASLRPERGSEPCAAGWRGVSGTLQGRNLTASEERGPGVGCWQPGLALPGLQQGDMVTLGIKALTPSLLLWSLF